MAMTKPTFIKALIKEGIPKKYIGGSISNVSFPFVIVTRKKPLPKNNFGTNRYNKQYYTFNARNVSNAVKFFKKPPQ